jgi:excisionase family DNA binding protein
VGRLKEEMAHAQDFQDLQLLKAEDVAQMLRIAKVTPYQWARKGVLPHYHLEGTIRFKLEDVKAFVDARRVEKRK